MNEYFNNLEVKKSMLTIDPILALEWHPAKNGKLKPSDVTPGSNRKVWWLCEQKHEWKATVYSRSKGARCPYCYGLFATNETCLEAINPDLAMQWHPTKNKSLNPENVKPMSGKKVWWLCEKGHEWEATIANRSNGSNCPYCSGRKASPENCLASKNKLLTKQWHPTKNESLKPSSVTPGSRNKVWWKCENGHEWKAVISHRNQGRGCPYCSGKFPTEESCFETNYPFLVKQWHPTNNEPLYPKDVMPMSGKKVWWLCEKGHEWEATIANRSRGRGCPHCADNKK